LNSSAGSSRTPCSKSASRPCARPPQRSLAEASLKATPVEPEDIPARWKPQPPKLNQDGLTKAISARDKALKEAEASPADALGVKQELEKALAQDGKPTT
jgi:hypothetical protein